MFLIAGVFCCNGMWGLIVVHIQVEHVLQQLVAATVDLPMLK